MKKLFVLVALVFAFSVHAQTTVLQGTGSGPGTKPWKATVHPGPVKTGAPTSTVSVSTTSAAATGLTSSTCYRVACSVAVFFRTGTSTPTALTTDNPIFGPSVESICVPPTDTAIAFVTASGTGTCTVTRYVATP